VLGGLSMAIVGAKHFYFAQTLTHPDCCECEVTQTSAFEFRHYILLLPRFSEFPRWLLVLIVIFLFSYFPIKPLHCRFAFAVGQIIFHNTLHTVKLLLLSCLYFSSTHTRDEWLFGGANGSGGPSRTSRGEKGEREVPMILHRKARFE